MSGKVSKNGPRFGYAAVLWTIQSLVGACQMDFSWNFQNTAIMLHPQDVVILLCLAWLLNKGFSIKHLGLIVPWMAISFYALYCYQLQGLEKLSHILNGGQRFASASTVFALYLHCFGFLLQVLVIVEIGRLALGRRDEGR